MKLKVKNNGGWKANKKEKWIDDEEWQANDGEHRGKVRNNKLTTKNGLKRWGGQLFFK